MKYRILQPLSFYAGALLYLTNEQARPRRAVLKPLGDGLPCYEVITEANFKAGEIIGFDGDLPKAMAASVEPVPMLMNMIEAEAEAIATAEAEAIATAEAEAIATAEAEAIATAEAASIAAADAQAAAKKGSK